MSKIFNVSKLKQDLFNIKSLINDMFLTLQTGNTNRLIIIDESIHKSLKSIKKNYSCLSYETSQITILTIASENLQHITYIFKSYFDLIDTHFNDSQYNIKIKNRDIFDYCNSALLQINSYINNFHYERMKSIC